MTTSDYPYKGFGFSERSGPTLTEALLQEGPFHGQIISMDAIEERELDGGYYQRDPACTYAPASGERYALYRWRQDKT